MEDILEQGWEAKEFQAGEHGQGSGGKKAWGNNYVILCELNIWRVMRNAEKRMQNAGAGL